MVAPDTAALQDAQRDDWTALLILLWIPLGLWIDARMPYGQPSADLVTWSFFLLLVVRASRLERKTLLSCLVYATLGEVFLALVWSVYTYRLANLPLFVPPGHVLLFCLGRHIAACLPQRSVVPLGIVGIAIGLDAILRRGDSFSIPLLVLFALALRSHDQRPLFVTMFLLAFAMELVGTSLGNWRWRESAPWLELAAANPPAAVGAFYVVLDRLVTWTARQR